MNRSSHTRTNFLGLLVTVILSAASMLWLFWHYPKGTSVATLVVLAGLGISARFAGFIQNEARPELQHRKHGA